MRYMGGKFTLAKHLLPFILETKPKRIIEPFLGGGNFMVRALKEGYAGEYIAGDYDKDNNFMWKCVIDGWLPKYEEAPTRDEYKEMKNAGFSENPLRGFARSVVAFGANPWQGYSLDLINTENLSRDFWKEGCNVIRRDADIMVGKDIKIVGGDYADYSSYITPESVVYCDPPYVNTRGYSKGETFDHVRFWNTVRAWSVICPVYVSELVAPDDFVAVFEKSKVHTPNGKLQRATVNEKLFLHESKISKGTQ